MIEASFLTSLFRKYLGRGFLAVKVAPVIGATSGQIALPHARMAYDKKDVVMEGVRGSPLYLLNK